jgi:hypothetical protein
VRTHVTRHEDDEDESRCHDEEQVHGVTGEVGDHHPCTCSLGNR